MWGGGGGGGSSVFFFFASFKSMVREITGIFSKILNSRVNGAIMMKSPQAYNLI